MGNGEMGSQFCWVRVRDLKSWTRTQQTNPNLPITLTATEPKIIQNCARARGVSFQLTVLILALNPIVVFSDTLGS